MITITRVIVGAVVVATVLSIVVDVFTAVVTRRQLNDVIYIDKISFYCLVHFHQSLEL